MGSSNNRLNCVFTALLLSINATFSYCLSINDGTRQWTRRDIISRHSPAAASAAALLSATSPFPSNAAPSLASKLSERDPSLLKNSVFNIPPPVQTYPPFLTGDWDITMKYRGFIFPSSNIPKEKLIKNFDIPGFQKLSIAMVGDVGKEEAAFKLSIDEVTKMENRKLSLQTSINGHLGYDAVREVIYDSKDNPNRVSVDFIPQRTRNANRIELFCNARESELVSVPSKSDAVSRNIFVCSEYIRQVTFGLSQEFGVARQISGNYAHFFTWRETENRDRITGNLLTAAYLDAQDAMFFQEPSKPVCVYSHDLIGSRVVV